MKKFIQSIDVFPILQVHIRINICKCKYILTKSQWVFFCPLYQYTDNSFSQKRYRNVLFFLHTKQIQYWVRGKKDLTFQEAEILLSDLTLRNARRKKRATQSYKYVLTGLLGYQNYEAQMRVVNTYYAGPPSVITSFTTELGGNHILIS